MSKRTLVYQSTGGILGLLCLNLALAPDASANGYNLSNGTGYNISNGSGYNISNGSGSCASGKGCYNGSNTTGAGGKPPWTNVSNGSGSNGGSGGGFNPGGSGSVFGNGKFPGLNGLPGTGIGGYNASTLVGLSQQLQQLLNAAQSAYAQASARLAQLQAQSAPAAQKDSTVRYARVADANIADCGCNAPTASAPDNSAELAAAKAAEAEAAASLAKAQEQARQFLESLKKNPVALGNSSPIW